MTEATEPPLLLPALHAPFQPQCHRPCVGDSGGGPGCQHARVSSPFLWRSTGSSRALPLSRWRGRPGVAAVLEGFQPCRASPAASGQRWLPRALRVVPARPLREADGKLVLPGCFCSLPGVTGRKPRLRALRAP